MRLTGALLAALAVFGLSQATIGQNPLPQDAKPTCTVAKAAFAKRKWLGLGQPGPQPYLRGPSGIEAPVAGDSILAC
jgi:hypothetical protein